MYIHVHMMTDKLLLQGVWGGGVLLLPRVDG